MSTLSDGPVTLFKVAARCSSAVSSCTVPTSYGRREPAGSRIRNRKRIRIPQRSRRILDVSPAPTTRPRLVCGLLRDRRLPRELRDALYTNINTETYRVRWELGRLYENHNRLDARLAAGYSLCCVGQWSGIGRLPPSACRVDPRTPLLESVDGTATQRKLGGNSVMAVKFRR